MKFLPLIFRTTLAGQRAGWGVVHPGGLARLVFLILAVRLYAGPCCAQTAADISEQLRALQRQNEAFLEQLRRQQEIIAALTNQVNQLQAEATLRDRAVDLPKPPLEAAEPPPRMPGWLPLGPVHLSGEGGVGFFHSARHGNSPNGEFRVDEARLFLEAPLGKDAFFYGELNLATREYNYGLDLFLGELYVDLENLSRFWNREGMLSLRLGRFNIPFGEDYLTRNAIDNPLISHSLADFWGVDEGLELYGKVGPVDYVMAVQNGGHPGVRDFTADKALVGRLGYDPLSWLHLGVSGMRTGDLDVKNDMMSELWFANGFIRSLGSTATTQFHANLAQGDVRVRLPHGHLAAAGGLLHYGDNDPAAATGRAVYFYSFEGVHDLTRDLYAAGRFSHILAGRGFPSVGNGDFSEYFYRELTRDLWRLSLGLGYRWSPNLVLKMEYTFERGADYPAGKGNRRDMISAEAAFRF